MTQTVTPKFNVKVQISGMDGNAFMIMGVVKIALHEAGATKEQIQEYLAESMSGDYDHLLQTAMKWVDAR